MKTNKSFTKRIKVTKNGKLISRSKGHGHFNAKESRKTRSAKRRPSIVIMTKKARSRFLPRT